MGLRQFINRDIDFQYSKTGGCVIVHSRLNIIYALLYIFIYVFFVNRLLYKVRIETPLALKCFNLVHLLVGNLDGGFYIKTVSQSGFKGTAAGKNLIFQI